MRQVAHRGECEIVIFNLPNWLTSYLRPPERAYLELQTLRSNIESGLVLSQIKDQSHESVVQKQVLDTNRTLRLFTNQLNYIERRYWARHIPLYGLYIKAELELYYREIDKVNESLRAWHGGGHTTALNDVIDA